MDLRDWFAGMAMQPILTSIDESFQRTWDSRSLTKDAYDLADAMLEAREAPSPAELCHCGMKRKTMLASD